MSEKKKLNRKAELLLEFFTKQGFTFVDEETGEVIAKPEDKDGKSNDRV